jgi:hypothetical protein
MRSDEFLKENHDLALDCQNWLRATSVETKVYNFAEILPKFSEISPFSLRSEKIYIG